MAWLSDVDTYAYCIANDIPLLDIYDTPEARSNVRISTYGDDVRKQQVAEIKNRDIQAYNRLVKQFPEVAAYG